MSDFVHAGRAESENVLQAVIAAAVGAYLAAERELGETLVRPRWPSAALAIGDGEVWPLGLFGWKEAEWPR